MGGEAAGIRTGEARVLERAGLEALLGALRGRGYEVIGPRARDGAIVYDEVRGVGDLPEGWTDEQEAGRYRLRRRADRALFGYNVGPHSWKRFLFPPEQLLWRARRSDGALSIEANDAPAPRYAFLGMRACELAAVRVQDRVFLGGPHVDAVYEARRADAFFVAVNCGQAAAPCFCVSMDTGPRATQGYDLALTEILEPDGGSHFIAEAGSTSGAEVLAGLPSRPAREADREAASEASDRAASQMARSLDADGIRELLYENATHPRWAETAERCLSCANCTMVCPTCFCSTVEDVSDLSGEAAERRRKWDSCFTMDFSYLVGGSVRGSGAARYRQWMTHKLGSWIDQFGTSGCVGCGRCIAWCPVGIDITEEAAALRAPAPRAAEEEGP